MSTQLFTDAPAITIGRTQADGQTVDWWIDYWPNHAATMHRGGRCADALTIFGGCPDGWLPGIIGVWTLLGDNWEADLSMHATHRIVAERFGPSTLEPILDSLTGSGVRS